MLASRELQFVKSQRVAHLATADASGRPHVVPVCPVVEGVKIYIASETKAKKIRNLRKNSNVTFVFDEYHDSWRGLKGVMIQGRAKVVDAKTFKRMRTKLYKKYPKYESDAALEYGESSIIEVIAKKKLAWGF